MQIERVTEADDELVAALAAGGAASFDFPATLEGIFEAELEDRGEQILELRVEP